MKISKRAGSYVTVRDLIDEVGRDAVRYFFLMRKGDSQLVFDVDLARSQSDENPVYYIQMAHARLSRHLPRRRDRPGDDRRGAASISRCSTLPEEQELMKALLDFPSLVAGAAEALEPHRVATYLHDTAGQDSPLVSQGARAQRAGADHARAARARARGADRAPERARPARHHRAGADVARARPGVERRGSIAVDAALQIPRFAVTTTLHSTRPPMTVLVVGSVALDSVETPFGKADNVLGGSGTFFSASASHLSPVQLVGVVGDDYPIDKLEPLRAARRRPRGTRAGGRRRRSAGADATATISTPPRRSRRTSACSRISARRFPSSSATRRSSSSRNIDPRLQLDVLHAGRASPKLVACDTMNFWIESRRPDLLELLEHVDLITLNDGEARQLTDEAIS